MFGRVYRHCTKFSKRGRNKRMDNTSQSRELAILPTSMQPDPAEFKGKDKIYDSASNLPSLQSMASPTSTSAIVTFQESIFKNSRQDPPRPFSTNTEQYIVVKTMKRQRDAYRQAASNSEATSSEESEAPKRRKTASENLALPSDLTGTAISAPQTPPGDVTPQLQPGTSTIEPPTPDASFDLRHKRQGSRLSQLSSSSTSTRINEIDLFKVVVRDQNPLYYQPEQHPPMDDDTRAQNYIDLAHAQKKVLDFHGAETEFLRAFQIYNRSKGPDSPEVFRTMSSMAEIYEDQTRLSEAPRRRRNCYVFCG